MDIDEFIRRSIEKNEQDARALLVLEKRRKIKELLQKSGLGRRFESKTFENYVVTEANRDAVGVIRNFVRFFPENRSGLLISGPVGTGKTHLAAAITNQLVDGLYSVICRNITDIIMLIRSTYGQKSDLEEWEIVDILTEKTDLLIIDDLGKERTSENTNTLLYQIANRIYEDEKPIVVTTNYTADKLATKFGERGEAIVSRLTEMTVPVVLAGDDWRVASGKNKHT